MTDEGSQARTASSFEIGRKLYLEVTTDTEGLGFVHLDDYAQLQFNRTVHLKDGTILEPRRLEIRPVLGAVLRAFDPPCLQSMYEVRPLPVATLYRELDDHIQTYTPLSEREREIAILALMFSWFSSKHATPPYLLLIGSDENVTELAARVVGELCFLPLQLSGDISSRALWRAQEALPGSQLIPAISSPRGMCSENFWWDAVHDFGAWIVLVYADGPAYLREPPPVHLEVIARRAPITVMATDAHGQDSSSQRFSFEDVSPILSTSYRDAVTQLRAKIAWFVLSHWHTYSPDWALGLESPLPIGVSNTHLSTVLQFFPGVVEGLRGDVASRQKMLAEQNMIPSPSPEDLAKALEWLFFHEALALAARESNDGQEARVSSKMIGDKFGVSAKRVTQTLKPLGITSERHRVKGTENGNGVERARLKQFRCLKIRDQDVWERLVDRFHLGKDTEVRPDCPAGLRGLSWEVASRIKK
ncbi:MAG: hypothetical protein ABFC89_06100 [Methanospirillum sp.]